MPITTFYNLQKHCNLYKYQKYVKSPKTLLPMKCLSETAQTQAVSVLKPQLQNLLLDTNRGIFGTKSSKKQEIFCLVEELEAQNEFGHLSTNLQQLNGDWTLLWSTITIQGSKRTKLGLREFVEIGRMSQIIDTKNSLATNEVEFNVAGMGALNGAFTIVANYELSGETRVNINFVESTLRPAALQQLFEKNYDLLLSIFNPEGWLEITYVDEDFRIGRDDKQNIFILQRPIN
eukprot:TRINITY_DN3179_c0_g1_i1.p2 TRINITY_DN3179_c0_g1~~TRINITY_DN3179_c0_g1_i1.p2  ORF type:complete len:245 (-),score=29.75 TRINITY_DN3179_c0_g1_i1:364-1062(-)